jgi:hypothetical protein
MLDGSWHRAGAVAMDGANSEDDRLRVTARKIEQRRWGLSGFQLLSERYSPDKLLSWG